MVQELKKEDWDFIVTPINNDAWQELNREFDDLYARHSKFVLKFDVKPNSFIKPETSIGLSINSFTKVLDEHLSKTRAASIEYFKANSVTTSGN